MEQASLCHASKQDPTPAPSPTGKPTCADSASEQNLTGVFCALEGLSHTCCLELLVVSIVFFLDKRAALRIPVIFGSLCNNMFLQEKHLKTCFDHKYVFFEINEMYIFLIAFLELFLNVSGDQSCFVYRLLFRNIDIPGGRSREAEERHPSASIRGACVVKKTNSERSALSPMLYR